MDAKSKTNSENKPANKGFIKRLLDWIAKGAEKPDPGGPHCSA